MAVGSARTSATRVSALVALLAGLFAAVLVAAPAASAHTELNASDPAQGASLAAAPTVVTLTFNEAVTLPANPVSVRGPAGAAWTFGTPSVAGAVVTVPVTGSVGPAGAYLLSWSVVADDGDPVTGTVNFALTAAVPPPTSSSATQTATSSAAPPATLEPSSPAQAADDTSDDGGVPLWVWIVILVVLAGVVGGVVVARRRSADA